MTEHVWGYPLDTHTASWIHLPRLHLSKRHWGDLHCDGDPAEQLLPSWEGQEGRQSGVVVPYTQQKVLQAAPEGRLDGTSRSGQACGWTILCPK